MERHRHRRGLQQGRRKGLRAEHRFRQRVEQLEGLEGRLDRGRLFEGRFVGARRDDRRRRRLEGGGGRQERHRGHRRRRERAVLITMDLLDGEQEAEATVMVRGRGYMLVELCRRMWNDPWIGPALRVLLMSEIEKIKLSDENK